MTSVPPSKEFMNLMMEFYTEEQNKASSSHHNNKSTMDQGKLFKILDYCKEHKFELLKKKEEIEQNKYDGDKDKEKIDFEIEQINNITTSILQYMESIYTKRDI